MNMINASGKINHKPIEGQRFGRLLVIELTDARSKSGEVMWKCKCDCGNETIVRGSQLRGGGTSSCGCLFLERSRSFQVTHGYTRNRIRTSEYNAWVGARSRCNNPSSTMYRYYGGRGITFCERWDSFENFLEDMGPKPGPKYSLERIDNSKGYCPGNVKWATRIEQSNNKRSNRAITINGQTKTVAQWARHIGINKNTIRNRLHRGWTVEKALFVPIRYRS